jgi:hypothetical protein
LVVSDRYKERKHLHDVGWESLQYLKIQGRRVYQTARRPTLL